MLHAIKSLFEDLRYRASGSGLDETDHRVAAAALILQVAGADGQVDAKEKSFFHRILKESFGLDEAAARRVLALALRKERETIDLADFTDQLNRVLNAEERKALVSLLWRMGYADGAAHELEEGVIARAANLLKVSPQDFLALKQEAETMETQNDFPFKIADYPR